MFVGVGSNIYECDALAYSLQSIPFALGGGKLCMAQLNDVLFVSEVGGGQKPICFIGSSWVTTALPAPVAGAAAVGAAGNVNAGTHYYRVRNRYTNGSSVSYAIGSVAPGAASQINMTLLPAAAPGGRADWLGWTLERTKANDPLGASGRFYIVATGNTVVFKPSEKTPMVAQLMAEFFQEAGFPRGVFNLLQGEREVGRRLCAHEGVDGVLFTGSYEVGTRIKQDTLQQHWKILALEMGGKNPSIIWEDAEISHAIHECLTSAFLTTGQRCSATSRILIHRSRLAEFLEKFHARAKAFAIGHPLDDPFMGPLIDSSSVDRFMKFQGIATREGAEQVMRGKPLETVGGLAGHYVTPGMLHFKESSLEATRKSVFQQNELFGPAVAVMGFTEIEEAIAQANATQYGLVASVFSRSRAVYDKCVDELQMGCINWNRSTVGASSRLPFGGLKKSGNHQPTALTSSLYCAYPVASLEQAEPKPIDKGAFPGMHWA
jgi:hypothetical protein